MNNICNKYLCIEDANKDMQVKKEEENFKPNSSFFNDKNTNSQCNKHRMKQYKMKKK